MGAIAFLGLALAGLAVVLIAAATREAEEEQPVTPLPPEEEEDEGIIDADYRSGSVFWAALTEWKEVYDRHPNTWPADTDITFAWEIRNTGNVGAYFQVYMISPGEWLYLEPGADLQVLEEYHTPAVPVSPGYQYHHINILGREITGERIGAVWTSEEIEVSYV